MLIQRESVLFLFVLSLSLSLSGAGGGGCDNAPVGMHACPSMKVEVTGPARGPRGKSQQFGNKSL